MVTSSVHPILQRAAAVCERVMHWSWLLVQSRQWARNQHAEAEPRLAAPMVFVGLVVAMRPAAAAAQPAIEIWEVERVVVVVVAERKVH